VKFEMVEYFTHAHIVCMGHLLCVLEGPKLVSRKGILSARLGFSHPLKWSHIFLFCRNALYSYMQECARHMGLFGVFSRRFNT
jgi:hypothetical protein